MYCAIKNYNGAKCLQELKLWLKRRLSRKNKFDFIYLKIKSTVFESLSENIVALLMYV